MAALRRRHAGIQIKVSDVRCTALCSGARELVLEEINSASNAATRRASMRCASVTLISPPRWCMASMVSRMMRPQVDRPSIVGKSVRPEATRDRACAPITVILCPLFFDRPTDRLLWAICDRYYPKTTTSHQQMAANARKMFVVSGVYNQ